MPGVGEVLENRSPLDNSSLDPGSGDVPERTHAVAGERCVGHHLDDITAAWRFEHEALADEHGHVSRAPVMTLI